MYLYILYKYVNFKPQFALFFSICMKRRIFYFYWIAILSMVGLSTRTFGQTITISSLNTSNVCTGGSIIVSYTTSGTFATGNNFSVQLSDDIGVFPASPTLIGTSSANTTSGTITATIPPSTAAGNNYNIRLASSNPVKISVNSYRIVINKTDPPSVTNPPDYCENDVPKSLTLNATPTAGSTLKWYSSTTPDTKIVGPTSYSVSQIANGCESPRTTITVTVNKAPNAPTVSPLNYCKGQKVDNPLSATITNASAKLNWYNSSGTAFSLTPIPSTTATGSVDYYVSQTLNGCESPQNKLTVTVTDPPTAPSVVDSYSYCANNTPTSLIATPSPGGVLRWYGTASSGGTFSLSATIPSASGIYYVSQIVGNCESSRAAITVTAVAAPSSPPTLKGPPPACAGSPAGSLTATTTDTSYQLRWYSDTNPNSAYTTTTPPVSNTATRVYYARQATKEGCTSALASVTVSINSLPAAPSVPMPDPFCLNRKTDRTLLPNGPNYKWYDDNNTLLPGAPSPPTDKTGPVVYTVSQTDANGCTSATRATVTAVVNPVPNPPSITVPRDYCAGETAQPLSATGINASAIIKWYGRDSTSTSKASLTPETGTALIGTNNYYVTQTVDGCASNMKAIPVRVKETPGLPTVQDYSFCQNYVPVSLSATPANGATLNWWGENASGGTRSSDPPRVPNTVDKTYTYYVSQTLNNCESGLGNPSGRAKISVRVKTTPGAPGVSPISFCNAQQAQALTANGQNLKWYDGSNNPLTDTPKPNTGSVGDQIYKVSQSLEGCESATASLTVTIKPLPSAPGVSDVSYCQAQQDQPTQNVSALSANGQGLKWYAGNTSLSGAPTPSIAQVGTQTYQVSQTVNGCEGGKADIRVLINTSSAPTTPKSLITYCVNDNATQLVASGDNGGRLFWVDPYNRTTNDAPTPSTINTNVTPGGDPFYVYQQGANGCYSARTTIKVIVTSPPTLALTAPTASVNLGQRAPLQLKFTSVGPYSYTITGGYTGTSRSTDTTISVLPRANTIYQIIGVSNGCGVGLPGNPATAQIIVRVPTVSTGSLSNTTLCAGTSLTTPFTTTGEFNAGNTFRMELVSAADTTKKYSVQTTANASPVTGTLPNTLPSGQYYVRVRADNPEIAITGSNSPTPLTVRSVASATLTGSQTIYEGVPANLTLTFAGDGPWTATYADSLRTYPVTTTTNPYSAEVRPTRTTTYRLVSISNSCGNGPVSGTATITVSPLLAVDDNPLDPLVKTYPIPTTTTLRIELNLPLTREPATLSLTDVSGRPISQHTTRNQQNELDLTAQPSGLYFLRIQVGDRQTVRKVLKQ